MDKRYVIPIVVLAAIAVTTQILLWLVRSPETPPAFVGPPRSNYTLSDFTLDALDEQGRLNFTVTASALARRNEDGSLWIEMPHFVLAGNDGADWKGESDAAWVAKDGAKMLLAGAVEMHRSAIGKVRAARIETRDATTWPKDRRIETAAPTTITQPGSILRGTGMKADLNTHQLELLANVHATFASKNPR